MMMNKFNINFKLFLLLIGIYIINSQSLLSQCTLTCPTDTTIYTDPDTCTALIDTLLADTSGGCNSSTLSYVLTGATTGTGDTLCNTKINLGLTKVTYTYDGNSCNFKILVKDLEPPSISGYGDITTSANPDDCGAQVYYDIPYIADNSETFSGEIVQYHDFNISSLLELTNYEWKFEGFNLYTDDTCLMTNVLTTSNNHSVNTPYYKIENGDTLFFTHWTIDYNADDDSLIIFIVNEDDDSLRIFEYECIDEGNKHLDTIELSVTGFYKFIYKYKTDENASSRGYLDDIILQSDYAHHEDKNGDISAKNTMTVFQLDSTYVSGDIFPVGETKIEYKVIDEFGNYSLADFTVIVSGGQNIISGSSEVEENSVYLYTTTSGQSTYDWTITGGIEYDGNGKDSIYILWNDPPNGNLSVSINGGASSCPFAVSINDINYGCFQYKRKLTINSDSVEADLENFPVLVYDTLNAYKHESYGGHIAHYNGYDIYFSSDSNGVNVLSHQLDYYDPVRGILAVWVLFPNLDGDADTDFYIHYGNSNIDRDISCDTLWNNDFIGIYHLGNSLNDYGRNGNDALNSGTESIDGKIGKARSFDRDDNDFITITNESPFNFTTSMFVSFWIYVESFPTAPGGDNDWMDIIIKGDNRNWRFVSNRTNSSLYYAFNNGGGLYDIPSTSNSFQTGHWYYIAGTWESFNNGTSADNIKRLYINDNYWNSPVPTYNSISDAAINSQPVIFGFNSDAEDTRSLDGIIDEVRISNIFYNEDWILTDYRTQCYPATFIAVGQETQGTIASSIGGTVDISQEEIFSREYVNGTLTGYSGSIQWQIANNLDEFTDIDGATSSSFTSEPVLDDSYFRALVSNRGCSQSSSIDSVNVIAGFIDCEYNFRRELIIDPDSVSGTDNLEDFPLLVEFNADFMKWSGNPPPDTGDVESEYGYDIIFTDDDGISIIPHEVEVYNPATGLFRAWVKVPELKTTDTTYVYMYYGKTGVTEDPSTSSAWGSEYVAVWHFNNNYRDTAKLNHGTGYGSPSFTTGQIGNGISFAGSSDYLSVTDNNDLDINSGEAISISAWIYINSFGSTDEDLISKGSDSWEIRRNGSTNYGAFNVDLIDEDAGDIYYLASGSKNISSGWHYICASFNDANDAIAFYVDTILSSTKNDPEGDTKATNNNSSVLELGRFNGILDEVRIAKAYRSEDWIATEFRNQRDPANFYEVREPRELCTANPSGGSLTSIDTVVCNDRNAIITLGSSDGNIYWQQSTDSINWDFILGETDTILITDILTDTMFYRAVVSESCCSDYSSVIRINYKDTDPPNVKIYVNNIACAGDESGKIDIIPQPETYNYTYNWSNGAITEDIENLAKGTYNVTIVDTDSDCNLKESRRIIESDQITITLNSLTDVSCSENDGAIDIAVTGGTLPDLLNFDTVHYVRIEDNNSLDDNITTEGSIEVRFYTTDTTRNGAILYKGDGTDSSYSLVLDENTLNFYFSNSGPSFHLSYDSIVINEWYHVAVDWTNNIILYVNGDPKDTVSRSNPLNTTFDSLYIGKKGENPTSSKQYFKGYIRDVKIWNRSRPSTNIQDSMRIPLIGTENGLLAYWPMDDTGNDSVYNKTTNENIHGEIIPNSGISWISSNYEYSWTNGINTQDIALLDTGTYIVTIEDAYGCFENRTFHIDYNAAAKIPPSAPDIRMTGNRYGKGPVVLKVYGPKNNCPDSAVRYIWYLTDTQGGQSVEGFSDSLYIPYQTASQNYYVASVNLAGSESNSRSLVSANVNTLDTLYRSLSLPATNDYINFGNYENYCPTNKLSVSGWVNFSNFDNNATIIENGWDGSNGFRLYYDGNDSKLKFEINSDANVVETNIDSLRWQHFAATYDHSKIKLYLNAVAVDSVNYSSNVLYSTDSLFLGKGFRGYIDDISIWDTALTISQIKAIMFQVLEVTEYDDDIYDGLNMENLEFYCNFNHSADAGNTIVTNNFLKNGLLLGNATITNLVPFDNWFPTTDENWHTTSNWYSENLPSGTNPGYAVINSDTAELAGSDAECKGLVIKKNAGFITSNNGTNKLTINGNIYNSDIKLNAEDVNQVESYSSFQLMEQELTDSFMLGNIASNAFQISVQPKGLRGFYFNDDTFKNVVYTQIDTIIDFDYETNSPNNNVENDGNYSILWVGQIQAQYTGEITFYITTEAKTQLFVNDSLIISCSEPNPEQEYNGTISITDKNWYNIILGIQETGNSGSIKLEWEYSGQSQVTIPSNCLKSFQGTIE